MSIDKSGMISATQSSIDSIDVNRQTCDLVALSATTNRITPDRSSFIALGCDLPDLYTGNTPEGTIFYVQELGIPVVASDTCWLGLDGRLYRNDAPETRIFGWGCNSAGQLGTNDTINASSPVQEVSLGVAWKSIGVLGQHNLAIKNDGTLWAWGCGQQGQLGTSSTINRLSPVQEASCGFNWLSIPEGSLSAATFSSALKEDGSLWTWGWNNMGQLGINGATSVSVSSPVREITSSVNWCFIAQGSCTASAIKSDGTLWGWGRGTFGILGVNDQACYSSPVREISSSSNWCASSLGSFNQVALKTDGTLWGWGNSSHGLPSSNQNISSPIQECTSSTNWSIISNSCALWAVKTDGTLWAGGNEFHGKLGIGCLNPFGGYVQFPVREITSSTNWCWAATGYYSHMGVKSDGTLWGTGGDGVLVGAIATYSSAKVSSPVQEVSSSTDWYSVSISDRGGLGIRKTIV